MIPLYRSPYYRSPATPVTVLQRLTAGREGCMAIANTNGARLTAHAIAIRDDHIDIRSLLGSRSPRRQIALQGTADVAGVCGAAG